MNKEFDAFVVREKNSKFFRSIEKKNISNLPKGEVLIEVYYSSINYKDILSCIGNKTVTRHYPHTPGIDAAGIVITSSNKNIKKGDEVVVISFDLGANTDGGFGQFIRVPAKWVMPLPEGLSLRESMIFGTAGFTAALAVDFLNKNKINKDMPVLVTGATGGVGSISLALLSSLGYNVEASTGKRNSINYLKRIGAKKIIYKEDLIDKYDRTLLNENWVGAIDTVGGKTLEYLIKSCQKKGVIVSAGMVSSSSLNTSIYPFILRGINLIGTGASEVSMKDRLRIWTLISKDWKLNILDELCTEISFYEIDKYIDKFLKSEHIGRTIVNLKKISKED